MHLNAKVHFVFLSLELKFLVMTVEILTKMENCKCQLSIYLPIMSNPCWGT